MLHAGILCVLRVGIAGGQGAWGLLRVEWVRRCVAAVEARLEGQLLGCGGCAEGERLQPFIAMLCEALCASYGDIAVVVPATLLRLLSPLLERHGHGAAGASQGSGQEDKG